MTPLLLDINAPEFVLLIVLAIILFGPERLPDLARKAARLIRYVRTMASSAQQQLSKELGPGFENVDFRDLNPKTFVQKHLLDDDDDPSTFDLLGGSDVRSKAGPPLRPGEQAPWDPDAT